MGEGAMPVAEVMTRKVITAKRSTTLKELMEIFRRFSLRTLPVVDRENKVIGVVALEDVLKIFQPHPSDILDMLDRVPFLDEYDDRSLWDVDIPPEMGVLCVVEDLMNVNVVTINEEATTIQARSLMKLHRLRRIPVVDKENCLLGIISLFDIIMAVFKQKGIL
ncbi:CBS domain-containing protein [Candidatus Aerophobetes bacterium]|uniref:CBS domain-containing protein n=1 Tax=Aerophobetes bacterium TaxID=2030807 RepID=A0A523TDC0_UNCAE|nr:MAG: CBS domain-containing protein [Candidatus Aerophobetes bacterium]